MPTETAAPVRHALNGATMGTRYAAVFFAPAEPPGLAAALHEAVSEVDRQMSTWQPTSNLMQFNAAPVGVWVDIPFHLCHVISAGLAIGRQSEGAFDIGLGDVVRAWGFSDESRRPDPQAVTALPQGARPRADTLLDLDAAALRISKRAPIAIDLSGIAKGYGVDRLAETLDGYGIAAYVVSIDGEVRARGLRPDGQPWRVGVESPVVGHREVAGVIELRDAALATSGDYRHRVELDGVSHSHTMDRATGAPLVSPIAAVTTRAPTCMVADAWATACMVLGPDRGAALARAHGVEALFAMR